MARMASPVSRQPARLRTAEAIGALTADEPGENTEWSFSGAISSVRSLFDIGAFRTQPVEPPAVVNFHFGDQDINSSDQVVYPVVKNTFIDFPSTPPLTTALDRHWKSGPGRLLVHSFHSKHPKMEVSHWQKTCTPCAYHLYKDDGCRMGDDCRFCHLCKPGEVKKRKREKARQKKLESRDQADAATPTAILMPVGLVHRDPSTPSSDSSSMQPQADELRVLSANRWSDVSDDGYDWRQFEALFKQAADACDDGSANSTASTQVTQATSTHTTLTSTSASSTGPRHPYPYWQQSTDLPQRRKLSPSRIRTGISPQHAARSPTVQRYTR